MKSVVTHMTNQCTSVDQTLPKKGIRKVVAMLLALSTLSIFLNFHQGRAQSTSSSIRSVETIAPDRTKGFNQLGSVYDAGAAWQNWVLNCQGCHLANGNGIPGTDTKLAGMVAKFLWTSGGRQYLIRVPGVATSQLSNDDLAAVLNWMLLRFDKQDIPAGFRPYAGGEVSILRLRPLRLEMMQMREQLLRAASKEISASGSGSRS